MTAEEVLQPFLGDEQRRLGNKEQSQRRATCAAGAIPPLPEQSDERKRDGHGGDGGEITVRGGSLRVHPAEPVGGNVTDDDAGRDEKRDA
ncbi:MAG TPA: hypothetical protein VG455_02185 [Acidimicrobiales bacterium]|nr:hypothetical protein [Acidimicrobiales bacterium]